MCNKFILIALLLGGGLAISVLIFIAQEISMLEKDFNPFGVALLGCLLTFMYGVGTLVSITPQLIRKYFNP